MIPLDTGLCTDHPGKDNLQPEFVFSVIFTIPLVKRTPVQFVLVAQFHTPVNPVINPEPGAVGGRPVHSVELGSGIYYLCSIGTTLLLRSLPSKMLLSLSAHRSRYRLFCFTYPLLM